MNWMKTLDPRRAGVWLGPVAFVLLNLACRVLAGPEQTPSASPTPSPGEPTQPVTPESQVSAATEVAPTGIEVSCANVHFWFDPSLTGEVVCETIAAVPDSGDVPPWEVAPEHIRIAFEGYVLPDTFHVPRIYVYPVAEYESLNDISAQPIGELQSLLEARPQTFDQPIPFLPPFNAAQILRTQVRYLDFQNGTGVRFLTLYGQALRVINNHELFYTFQGLKQDGAYYVAAVLPVSHPSLPAQGDIPADQFDSFAETFEDYLEDTEQSLEAEAPAAFMPDLALLDAMIQSLEVR